MIHITAINDFMLFCFYVSTAGRRRGGSRNTGSFILIDPETYDTIALGIIEAVKRPTFGTTKANLRRLILSAETRARSIAKAASWRATGSLDTFMIAALITGNSKLAGGVALAEI